jgi:hypothetical protein
MVLIKSAIGFDMDRSGTQEPDAVRNAVAYAKYSFLSHSHRAIIRVLNDSGAVIQTHDCPGSFRS